MGFRAPTDSLRNLINDTHQAGLSLHERPVFLLLSGKRNQGTFEVLVALMNIANPFRILLSEVTLLVIASFCLAGAMTTLARDSYATEVIDSLRASYQTILVRNPFNLQPPPEPEPELEPEPESEEEESPELDELNLKIAGVSAKDDLRRVWMAMTIPNPDPELPPVERFFSFTESEDEHHGVKVTRIGMDGNIAIEYYGKSHDLTFEDNRYQGASGGKRKKPAAKGKPGSNVKQPTRISARELIQRRAAEQAKKASGSNPNRSLPSVPNNRAQPVGAVRPVTNNSGNLLRNAVAPVTRANGLSLPAQQIRNSPNNSQQFSREEQMLMIEAARALNEREGIAMPPIPGR